MSFARDLRRQILDPTLSTDERARLRCRLAEQLQQSGEYEAAREALGELWPAAGERPNLDGLERWTAAEVLLRVGALIGRLDSIGQIEGITLEPRPHVGHSLLARALVTHGIILCRLHRWSEARIAFERAILKAHQSDDRECAGMAALTLMEELGEYLSEDELNTALKF